MIDTQLVVEQLKELCDEVGQYQLSCFRQAGLEVDAKSCSADLVTNVDKTSEAMILAYLGERYPMHSFLSEESGQDQVDSDYQWIIDPLDGTNNFAHGLPIFAISIALNYCGETIVGAVYAPYISEFFYAVKDEGAFCSERRLQVSKKVHLSECVLGTGFPYDKASHKDNNIPYFSHLTPQLRGVRRMGAAAYDLCMVAMGSLDGYWELNLNLWDIAAGALLVTEAGGVVKKFRQDRKESIIAGNEQLLVTIEGQIELVDAKKD